SSTGRMLWAKASLSMYFTVTCTSRGSLERPKTSLSRTTTVARSPSDSPALSASITPLRTGAVCVNVPTETVVDLQVAPTSDVTTHRISALSLRTVTSGRGSTGQVACTIAGWRE